MSKPFYVFKRTNTKGPAKFAGIPRPEITWIFDSQGSIYWGRGAGGSFSPNVLGSPPPKEKFSCKKIKSYLK